MTWADLARESTSPARSNAEVQTQLLAGLDGPPGEVAERLVGVDGATAEAVVVLGADACEALLTRLARAVRLAAPVLSGPPQDAIAAQDALTVASCWNDIVVAGRGDLPAAGELIRAWLDEFDADDPELERQLAFVVPALGSERALGELVTAGERAAPVAQPENIGPVLASAVLEGGAIDDAWRSWLHAAPEWLSSELLGWQDLLWAARTVYARIGGEPVDRVLPALRRATLGE
jgi:hypothetical protein